MLDNIISITVSGRTPEDSENKLLLVVKLFLLGLSVHFIFSIIQTFLIFSNFLEKHSHPATEGIAKYIDQPDKLLYIFMLSVILHPLVEELSFRFFLDQNKRKVAIGLGFMIAFVLLISTEVYKNFWFHPELNFVLLLLFIGFPVSVIFYCILLRRHSVKLPVGGAIFISSFFFAVIHYRVVDFSTPLSVVKILPYFFIGYILSYMKLKANIFYSWLLHSSNNLFFFSINFFMASHFSG